MCLKGFSAFHVCPFALPISLFTSSTNSHLSCSLPLWCSLHPREIYCTPLVSQTHIEQLRKHPRLQRRQLRNTSRRVFFFSLLFLQAKHLICGEVVALTNNTGASCYLLYSVTHFDISPLGISICSVINTDCFAVGVISASEASRLLMLEKSEAQLS